jgi:polyisoprenyl-teichoic acid--peptidoglycan teichoic acid transferase
MENRLPPSPRWRSPLAVIEFIAIVFVSLFVCGALFFGYQIYDTAREAVIALGLPDVDSPPAISAVLPLATEPAPNIAAGERVNVLLMGTDCRPIDKGVCRTDTMALATLDPRTETAGIISMPRDLWVPIPGVGESRINTANWYGALNRYPGGGPALAKKTVEYNFGRRVHYYALIDFNGFRKAIDALGGIDVNVLKAVDDPEYPTEDYRTMHIHFNAGLQHMNGEQALQYARTRHQDGDFGRNKRTIQVLLAARDKALRLDLLPKLPVLLQSMWGTFETDMKPQEILALAQVAAKVKTENIKSGSIDQTMTVEFRASTGADVLWFDRVKVGQLIDQIIPRDAGTNGQAGKVKQEAASVIVLNGTSNEQMAERATKYLQAQGFQIYSYGNADRFDYANTVLVDYTGNKSATVAELAKLFRVDPANIRRITNIKSDVDIRVILGADWTPPQ